MDHDGEDRLGGVDLVEVIPFGERQARQHHDAHARAEVAAISGDQRLYDQYQRAHLAACACLSRGKLFGPARDHRREGEKRGRGEEQPGHQLAELCILRLQQQPGPGQAADTGDDGQRDQAFAVALGFFQVGKGGRHLPRQNRDGAGGIGDDRWQADPAERAEGKEGAAPRHGIDRPGGKSRGGQQRNIEKW